MFAEKQFIGDGNKDIRAELLNNHISLFKADN
jgi:hypothetical protein